ncbi:MAG: hypothetical protein KDB07_02845, partial [Planctomycetes bacterium]|nr:hypothetical protein [Planctomycetota bacterium]
MRRVYILGGLLLALLCFSLAPTAAQDGPADDDKAERPPADTAKSPEMLFELADPLGISMVSLGSRSAVFIDHLLARLTKEPSYTPTAGDKLSDDLEPAWQSLEVHEKGGVEQGDLRAGYVYWQVECDAPMNLILDARGHSYVLVNGEPRGGDVYNRDRTKLPVALNQGINRFFFKTGRGRLRAELWQRPADVFVAPQDMTLPDYTFYGSYRRPPSYYYGGVIVSNASNEWVEGLELETALVGVSEEDVPDETERMRQALKTVTRPLPLLAPLSTNKICVELPSALAGDNLRYWLMRERDEKISELNLAFRVKRGGKVLSETPAKIRVIEKGKPYKETFWSSIDGTC